MKIFFVGVLVGMFVISATAVSFAAADADEAKAMVESAISFLKANGKDKTLAEVSNQKGKFVKGDVYVIVLDMKATMLAHPYNPKLIGKEMLDVPDPDGRLFRKEQVEGAKTKGWGWVDYKYRNPLSNKIENKTAYYKKADDMIFACGVAKK
jgi:cytochrome c